MNRTERLICALSEIERLIGVIKNSLKEEITEKVVPKGSEAFKQRFIDVLKEEKWNRTETAKRFGVGRRTIYRWMKDYGFSTIKERNQ